MIKIFDTHAHYTSSQFDEDRLELLKANFHNNVGNIVDCATSYENSCEVISLCEKFNNMYCAVGIHPEDVETAKPEHIEKIKELTKHEKVVAIGECGLDYYWDTPVDLQKFYFEEFLKLAKELDMPIIIHDREAHADTMELLKKYKPKGVVHCYSGSAEMAKEIVKLGMYIGFTGVLTFKNARKAIEAVEVIPMDKLLLETDCPYMAPVPKRGKRCDSSLIEFTAEKMAEIKGVTKDEMIKICHENGCKLFSIKENF